MNAHKVSKHKLQVSKEKESIDKEPFHLGLKDSALFLEIISMKFVHSVLIFALLLAFGACKPDTNANTSDTLAASNPKKAMNDLSSSQEFCHPSENAGANSCEKILLQIMNSPKFKGKEILISCGTETAEFVYDGSKGGGGTIGPELAARLKRILRNPNTNKNILGNSCKFGIRPAD